MVVHAGRDQKVAHVVHAGKKGVCRLVACAVVLVWKLKTFFQFMSVIYTLWLYKNRVFLCKKR